MESFNLLAIVGLVSAVTSASLAGFTLFKGQERIHFIWAAFVFAVALWGAGIYKFSTALSEEGAIFWWRIAEVGVILMPVFLTHFILEFLSLARKKISILFLAITYLVTFYYLYLNLFTNNFFGKPRIVFDIFYITPTIYYSSFIFIIFFGLVIINILILLYSYIKESSKIKKAQIKYLILAFAIGFLGGATSFLPVYGIDVYPVYNITIFISASLLTYNMFKNALLGMKFFAIQVFIIALNLIAFIYIFIPTSVVSNMIFFVGVLMVSFILKRSFDKEVKQKEELEVLSKKLAKNNRKLKELDDAKNEFISITAHQLRTPPTVIKGYINMAQEDPNNELDDETRDALDRALISNERLIDLIEDILSVSRIESGKMKYEMKEDQDMEAILQEVYEAFLLRAHDKGLELFFSEPEKHLSKIFMDGKKIREVISNLVDNAIKYTRKGKIEIVASERDDNIRIEIRDTGVGIPQEEMPYLFKKFSRGKNPGRLGAEGTGLGIFVGKKIIEDHGGKIWIESEGADKGSTFIIELPVRTVEQEEKRIFEEEKREKMKEARQEEEVEKFVEEI